MTSSSDCRTGLNTLPRPHCCPIHTKHKDLTTQRGFTLIELVVALAIFAVLSSMAYSALRTVLTTRDHVDRQMARLSELQTAFNILSRDIEQAAERATRDELGDAEPALRGGKTEDRKLLAFTRTGWRNPLGLPRSTLQRVEYVVDNNQLLRRTWNTLDRVQDTTPQEAVLLDKVSTVELRFLNTDMQWLDHWPPQSDNNPVQNNSTQPPPNTRPRAVEINIELDDFGKITRLFQAGNALWPKNQM